MLQFLKKTAFVLVFCIVGCQDVPKKEEGPAKKVNKEDLKSVPRVVVGKGCEIATIFDMVFVDATSGKFLNRGRFDAVNGSTLYAGIAIRPKIRFVRAKEAEANVTLKVTSSLGRSFLFRKKGGGAKVKTLEYTGKTDAELVKKMNEWEVFPMGIRPQTKLKSGKSESETITATITLQNEKGKCTDTHNTSFQWIQKSAKKIFPPITKTDRKNYTLRVSSLRVPIWVPIYPKPDPSKPQKKKVHTFPMNLFWNMKNPFQCPCKPGNKYKVVQFAKGFVSIRGQAPYKTPFHIDTLGEQQDLANQGKNYDPSFTLDPFDKDPNEGNDHIRPVLDPRGKPAVGHSDAPGVPDSIFRILVGKGGYVVQTFRAFLLCHNPEAYKPGANTPAEFLRMGVVAELNYEIRYEYTQFNKTPRSVQVTKHKYIKHNCKKKKLADFVKGEFKAGYEKPVTELKQ